MEKLSRPKNVVILCVIHHRQDRLESTCYLVVCNSCEAKMLYCSPCVWANQLFLCKYIRSDLGLVSASGTRPLYNIIDAPRTE
jgi:hypothetical protein